MKLRCLFGHTEPEWGQNGMAIPHCGRCGKWLKIKAAPSKEKERLETLLTESAPEQIPGQEGAQGQKVRQAEAESESKGELQGDLCALCFPDTCYGQEGRRHRELERLVSQAVRRLLPSHMLKPQEDSEKRSASHRTDSRPSKSPLKEGVRYGAYPDGSIRELQTGSETLAGSSGKGTSVLPSWKEYGEEHRQRYPLFYDPNIRTRVPRRPGQAP